MKRINFFKSHLKSIVFALFVVSQVSAQDIAINEVMASNNTVIDDEDGDFSDWIEIYNYGGTAINLNGYGLSDDITLPFKWMFPAETIQPGDFLLVYASGKDRSVVGQELHTNFSISSGGEDLQLTEPSGMMIDQTTGVALQADVSYGRQPDGTGAWKYFYSSTPGSSNLGTGLNELLLPPTFSHESGLFTAGFDLTLTHANPNATIVYTTDGSEPKLSDVGGVNYEYKNEYPTQVNGTPGPMLTDSHESIQYSSVINVYDRSVDPDDMAAKNTRQHDIYVPINPVRKGFVVRARAYVNGIASTVTSKTFFVWSGGNPYNIPLISIQTNERNLFDYDDGIYNAGVDFDTWRANNPNNNQYYRPQWNNYWRSGSAWEYPANIEIFESSAALLDPVININAGMRIHGNNSRSLGIKNLRLYARSEYDTNSTFQHDIFKKDIFDAPVPNTEFKRLMLRGDGSGGSIAYDVVFNTAMQPIYSGATRIQPAVHFFNGEFWGLTAFRDRIDDRYFEFNYDLNVDNIAIIDCKGANCGLDEGISSDFTDFISMRDFIRDNDMSNQALYDQVEDILDMTTFIDHEIMEIFSANNSFERKFWRARVPENGGYGDGKWRITVQDFEAAMQPNINWLEHYLDTTGSDYRKMFGNLIENQGFKNQFINRFADVMNTVLGTTYFNNVVNDVFNEVNPYLLEDENRFPRVDFYKSSEQQELLDWGTNRPGIQRDEVKSYFSINSIVDFELDVSSDTEGFIKINTIDIEESTPGVPQNPYPWIGQYFHNIPVRLEAKALPGYMFSHWSGDQTGTNPVITVTATNDQQIQANFIPISNPQEMVYFWMFDGETPNDTPFENVNVSYADNNLAASIEYNSCLAGYPFTPTHQSWRKASFERKNEPTSLNYFSEANNNVPYANADIKGVQVRQPFRSNGLENHLIFNVPTNDLQDIALSLAVMSNGAAESILVDYWDGSQWIDDDMTNPVMAITGAYEVLTFDFTNVALANNNPNFKIRMRFDGSDMTADNSDEVIMNNIALLGVELLSIHDFEKSAKINVYPNPTNKIVTITSDQIIEEIEIYNIYGQRVGGRKVNKKDIAVDLERYETGVYLVKVVSQFEEQTVRVVKQ
ncbi:CotH kinase family protein [Brumimicrobium aurantiacum]|uniref:T9SS C-terminal target domain-containing protein n=1 Tax=Brumimicrobium aurantiacum TaxID=1737063 RepID=A0A3E1EVJ0_9FLAO|nr:CotH kinase family protein [Brumimicrobium aurantiacum]RFC53571.1 T9SS C-terminal target domain-containing protein [Brumimicrobium aurantiacum]